VTLIGLKVLAIRAIRRKVRAVQRMVRNAHIVTSARQGFELTIARKNGVEIQCLGRMRSSRTVRRKTTPRPGTRLQQLLPAGGESNLPSGAGVAVASQTTAGIYSLNETKEACRTFIIAVDTSPASHAACKWVVKELYKEGDCIHVVHCIPPLSSQGLYAMPDGHIAVVDLQKMMKNDEEYMSAAQRIVGEWMWHLFKPQGIPYVIDIMKEEEVIAGEKSAIARCLCQKADALSNVAALIMTSHGRGRPGEIVWGSIAIECSNMANVPVVVLHQPNMTMMVQSNTESKDKGIHSGGAVKWLTDAFLRTLGHMHSPDQATAADVLAVRAAGIVSEHKTEDAVRSNEMDELIIDSDDQNLIGQAVGELPGTDLVFESTKEEKKQSQLPRTLIVAVDDSDTSERACEWTATNLWRKGDVIHLLHVITALPSVVYGAGPMSGLGSQFVYVLEPPVEAYKQATEQYMERRFQRGLKMKEIPFESEIALEVIDGGASSIANAILSKAETLGASALVVGSHSRGGLKALVLGSTAMWLCHHSRHIPIVVVH
jgi:nucleotide-binding universal stress UspA family protein